MKNEADLIKLLEQIAKEETLDDLLEKGEDVVIDDYAGGNVDDAYWKGHSDGQIDLARKILKVVS